jgi:hypothetical protein
LKEKKNDIMDGRIGRRGRRRKQLMDDLKGIKVYSNYNQMVM